MMLFDETNRFDKNDNHLHKSYPIKINPKKSKNWSKYNSFNHLKYKSQINKDNTSVTKALKK